MSDTLQKARIIPTLEKIITAIAEKQWLDVDYSPVEATLARMFKVFPHRIYTYSGSLYLLATFRYHKEPGSLLIHLHKLGFFLGKAC